MEPYVALLRGVNVGGENSIGMPALKACFEAHGHRNVSPYIQSGNVVFTTGRTNARALTGQIEKALSSTFTYESRVVVRSFEQMKAIVQLAPKGFGRHSAAHRYDVIFLREPLTVDEALKAMTAKRGVDRIWAGDGAIYISRSIRRAAESRLRRVIGTPAYQSMTIRSWNTARRLLELMERVAPTRGGGRRSGSTKRRARLGA